MKMAVRMPDALKTERDEIDENDWVQIQTVINEALAGIKGASISKSRFSFWVIFIPFGIK